MTIKKTLLYFFWQTIRFAENAEHRSAIWQYKNKWLSALQPGRNSMADEWAWINFEALDHIEQYLHPESKVFEYGGGGSTLFFLKRAGFVATVENDKQWFSALEQAIAQRGIQRWRGFFKEGQPIAADKTRDISFPDDYKSNANGQENLSYEDYARCIEAFPFANFDLVLVDGRARPSCMHVSAPYIKSGGFLVVDNMERNYYRPALQQLLANDFEVVLERRFPTPYHPDFTITGIYRKK
jgi:hypothetical protein